MSERLVGGGVCFKSLEYDFRGFLELESGRGLWVCLRHTRSKFERSHRIASVFLSCNCVSWTIIIWCSSFPVVLIVSPSHSFSIGIV